MSEDNKIRAAALIAFAERLRQHRPSAAQLAVSSEYNQAVVRALEWAENEARTAADKEMTAWLED